ncbi:trichodiene oxygenase [Xylariaceae sp. FL0255]|nr:trichodiene oxygenase [Xylariaceae sp. FL0255]
MASLIRLASWLSWQVIATSFSLYLVTVAIYRLFFHPLSGFPGPKLAAITRWYEAYYDVVKGGQYTFKIAELHRVYGPIIRISPYELHINDYTFFNSLYCQEGRWHRYAWAWDAWGAEGPTIHTIDHERHKARRQPLAPFFSKAKVSNQQATIARHVETLCGRLSNIAQRRWDNTVNLGAAVTALARDVSFEFILSKNYNSLNSEDFDVAVSHAAEGAGRLWRLTKHIGFIFPIVNSIPIDWAMKISDDAMKTFFVHMKAAMNDTKDLMAAASSALSDSMSQQTIVHEIVRSKLPPRDKAFKRVFEDVASVSGAGFETVGAVLRLICFYVFDNSDILQKLRAEIDSAKSETPDVMSLKVLERLPYLTATLMEGLRLSPGIATRMARIAPDRDLSYQDFRIPAGTPVGMETILIHTDENLYPSAKSFRPERWIDKGGLKSTKRGFAPSSRGTRMCLGMYLALAEIYLVVAALVQQFDVTFINAKAEDFECVSDQFVIGTRGKGVLEATIQLHKS